MAKGWLGPLVYLFFCLKAQLLWSWLKLCSVYSCHRIPVGFLQKPQLFLLQSRNMPGKSVNATLNGSTFCHAKSTVLYIFSLDLCGWTKSKQLELRGGGENEV